MPRRAAGAWTRPRRLHFTSSHYLRSSQSQVAPKGGVMPCLQVLEPSPGDRPSINDDAAKITDPEGNRLFVYGGTRWRKNTDKYSPTHLPTADFWMVDLVLMKWVNINVSSIYFRENKRPLMLYSLLFVEHEIPGRILLRKAPSTPRTFEYPKKYPRYLFSRTLWDLC